MRLVNTFAISHDKEAALRSYCEVAQMEDLPDLVEKMKSPEFKEVLRVFGPLCPKEVLNKRFAVFYGAPGGGKTYAARKACAEINGGDNDTIACHAGMDPADMLYAYYMDYATGRKGYRPTALLTAMTYGRAVVLDEVNLLPMESRMFLQDILDNKDSVHIMGTEIPIRDGFFVIGTMNLETGMGMTPLPLPLVDRASVVREFRTTVEQCCVGAGLC
jgi:MoxR-like ATPase